MHKLFEYVSNQKEAEQRLEQMYREGAISKKEVDLLREKIEKAWQNPVVASWFNPQWTEVRNEHAILLPGGLNTRRPDRVLIKGSEAIIVDYKFGQYEKSMYVEQIKEYIRLLQQMGYRQVHGYLWYVALEQVVPVSV